MQPRDTIRRVEITKLHEVDFEGKPLTTALRNASRAVAVQGYADIEKTQEKLKWLAGIGGGEVPPQDRLDAMVRALHQFGENAFSQPKIKVGEPFPREQMRLFLSAVHYLTPADAPEGRRAVDAAMEKLKLYNRLPEEELSVQLATLPEKLVSKRART